MAVEETKDSVDDVIVSDKAASKDSDKEQEIETKDSVNGVKVFDKSASRDSDKEQENESNTIQEANETLQESKDFEISDHFLNNFFKYDEEADAKVWQIDRSQLPAVVQVVRICKEKNDSQAFSVCDGNGYLWNSCFISRDQEVTLNTLVKIISLENVKNEDYDKDDFLTTHSVFDDVLALAEFEVVHPGDEVGHCLWNIDNCKQLYVLASGSLDSKDDQFDVLNNKDLWELTNTSDKCDVRFQLGDGQVLHAHKHVLRGKSSVFEAHFGDEGAFTDQELVNITDSNFEVFRKFLKWIYGFNVQFDSLETIFSLIYLSDKYIVAEFLDILRKKVEESLKFAPQNAVAVSNLNTTNDVHIQGIVMTVIDKNIQLLFNSGEFKKWDLESLVLITARDSLNIDEWQLLQFVFFWGEENVQTQEQFMQLLINIRWQEIDKEVLRNFIESQNMKEVVARGLLHINDLESIISLKLFKNTSSLEKRLLFSRDISNFSTYRTLDNFSSDPKDISILPPVVFPLQLSPGTLTSLPMVLLNDSFTLIQPNIQLTSLKSGRVSLSCLIRLSGAVSGLPDMSVFRQADYFRHVADMQATVELYWGDNRKVLDLTQGGVMMFKGIDVKLVKDVMTGSEIFRGSLVVRQFRADTLNSSTLRKSDFEEEGETESEPEGEDLGHDDDEEDESDDEQEELSDFIEDEAEVSGEEEEALEENGEDSAGDEEESDTEKSSEISKRKKRKVAIEDSGGSEDDGNADEEDVEGNEAEFSSDEEVEEKSLKKLKSKRKVEENSSESDEEITSRKKKRRRAVVDSASDEEEDGDSNVPAKRKKNNIDSDEESEYETDDEMGDETQNEEDRKRDHTPEAQFSTEEDDAEEAQFSEDGVDIQNTEEEDKFQVSEKDVSENREVKDLDRESDQKDLPGAIIETEDPEVDLGHSDEDVESNKYDKVAEGSAPFYRTHERTDGQSNQPTL